jgi:RNA polymerase sigma factor (sigma-70 family)
MKEYRVQVTVKNNLLLSAIEKAGYKSVAAFCDDAGLQKSLFGELINLKASPMLKSGEFSTIARKTLDFLGALPEDLWTEEQLFMKLETNKGYMHLDKQQMDVLSYGEKQEEKLELEDLVMRKELQSKVQELVGMLTPKAQLVLKLRFGMNDQQEMHTLEEIADKLNVTKERVRQIESNALRKIRDSCLYNADTRQVIKDWDLTNVRQVNVPEKI